MHFGQIWPQIFFIVGEKNDLNFLSFNFIVKLLNKRNEYYISDKNMKYSNFKLKSCMQNFYDGD